MQVGNVNTWLCWEKRKKKVTGICITWRKICFSNVQLIVTFCRTFCVCLMSFINNPHEGSTFRECIHYTSYDVKFQITVVKYLLFFQRQEVSIKIARSMLSRLQRLGVIPALTDGDIDLICNIIKGDPPEVFLIAKLYPFFQKGHDVAVYFLIGRV